MRIPRTSLKPLFSLQNSVSVIQIISISDTLPSVYSWSVPQVVASQARKISTRTICLDYSSFSSQNLFPRVLGWRCELSSSKTLGKLFLFTEKALLNKLIIIFFFPNFWKKKSFHSSNFFTIPTF